MTNPIYYISLDVDKAVTDQVAGWVGRFCQFIGDAPLRLPFEARPVNAEIGTGIRAASDEPSIGAICDGVVEAVMGGTMGRIPRVLIVCNPKSNLASRAREKNPNALWGGALGPVAFVYQHDPLVVWHELFHTLGAEDCYPEESPNEDAIPTCGQSRCIMQYAPLLSVVGDPPFMCEKNLNLIRSR
jgi:hypothetical protein